MSNIILFQQLLILLTIMFVGYISYRCKIIDNNGYNQLSSLVIKILNPFLMISGVLGNNVNFSANLINQNIILVCFFYLMLFVFGFIFIKTIKCKDNSSYLYRMLILLPNVGFMGIPLVKEVLGSKYIVLVAFYILGFNIIAYTYGVYLSYKFGGKNPELDYKKIINIGTISSFLSIGIFASKVSLPVPLISFVNYMGESCIVMSMIVIGAFLAKENLKSIFLNLENIVFIFAYMIVIPLLMIFIAKKLNFDPKIFAVFQIMTCMPVGSVTCMFAQEYGGDGTKAAHLVATTTVATIVTVPAVFYLSVYC